jgi:PIN domain nuclease of toxin-antitoxin system
MRLLLDTHVCVWSAIRPTELSPIAAEAMRDPASEIFVSAVSAYEIEYKRRRDPLLQLLPTEIDDAVRLQGLSWLPITSQHCTIAARLPQHHRDPWGRIIVAQAMLEGLQLVTVDHKLAAYGVPILW